MLSHRPVLDRATALPRAGSSSSWSLNMTRFHQLMTCVLVVGLLGSAGCAVRVGRDGRDEGRSSAGQRHDDGRGDSRGEDRHDRRGDSDDDRPH
jgi:hypothetical protein